jgi:hypothetical protein
MCDVAAAPMLHFIQEGLKASRGDANGGSLSNAASDSVGLIVETLALAAVSTARFPDND